MKLNKAMTQLVGDVIITAVEGGCSHWARARKYKFDLETATVTSVEIQEEEEDDWHAVDVQRMAKTLEALKPSDNKALFIAWAHAKCEVDDYDFDADDADITMQLCVLKEVIYG